MMLTVNTVMFTVSTMSSFSLEQLLALVAEACPPSGARPDGRLAARVDERTFRYWQSLGLVDRPVAYEARVARYSPRSVRQAVAVRRLQERGWALAQIQAALAGATDEALDAWGRGDVREPPAGSVEPLPTVVAPLRTPPSRAAAELALAAPALATRLCVELAPGVTLLLDPAHVADPAALVARLTRALPGDPA